MGASSFFRAATLRELDDNLFLKTKMIKKQRSPKIADKSVMPHKISVSIFGAVIHV